MTDVELIAKSLTKAQVKALLWLPADGTAREHDKAAPREVSFWAMRTVVRGNPEMDVAYTYSLCKRGDGERRPGSIWPATMWCLTPLGLTVRAHLSESQS